MVSQTEIIKEVSPTDPDEEAVVAYLDDEMSPDEKKVFEDRLANEPQLRNRMVSFEESWNALSLLETVPPNKEWIRSTIELVAVRAESELHRQLEKPVIRKPKHTVYLLAGSLLALIVGYLSVNMLFSSSKDKVLDDLQIIDRMNQYMLLDDNSHPDIDEIDFLRKLNESQALE